ncbi:mannonate dehydratase [Bifidobacterium sp. W8108]|uniref:mannonate dehydratase n=1 Tax=unclassified Bifidobacterium TaxID=2608897 RepID=UPI0018DC0D7D|nr:MULTISPECIES: mannonate dehydratase [Bifidobacterium]MBH9978350.1 mannonate dehydratase [Bifidobacterium sp. W8108]MBI0173780.1 mannonate dehydratase [Bifidobacterium sp. M0307]
MHMGFRWYGEGNDTISLDDIRQIPGVETIVWSLHHKQAGEVWQPGEIEEAMATITGLSARDRAVGITKTFNADVVESVNVHESIKTGSTVLGMSRDQAIDAYIETVANLGKAGVRVVTYNFMPVFDWLRTEMFHPCPDGSTALYYNQHQVDQLSPQGIIDETLKGAGTLTVPGWEPERLAHLPELMEAYQGMDHELMYANYKYFLDAVIPTCERYDVRLAVHPDDPAFDLFGWPRVVSSKEGIQRVLDLNPSPYNGLCLCLGSFSSRRGNDAVDAVRTFMDRIHFSHVRNIRFTDEEGSFFEVGHRASEGDVDTVGIMQAYAEADYQGYIRPDHGRHLWSENTEAGRPRPGYGLYDRAMGIQYLLGVWDAYRNNR